MSNDELRQSTPVQSGSSGPPFMLFGVILVAIGVAVFIFQNGDRANVQFLMFDGNIRTWVVILVSMGAGILLDRVVLAWWRRARRRGDG
ncbi:MAG: hypothetical protein AAGF91_04370 [Actinomycetota bacterium]